MLYLEVWIGHGCDKGHLTYLGNWILCFERWSKCFFLLLLKCFILDRTDPILKLLQVKAYRLFMFRPALFYLSFRWYMPYGQLSLKVFIVALKILVTNLTLFGRWIKIGTLHARISFTFRIALSIFYLKIFLFRGYWVRWFGPNHLFKYNGPFKRWSCNVSKRWLNIFRRRGDWHHVSE